MENKPQAKCFFPLQGFIDTFARVILIPLQEDLTAKSGRSRRSPSSPAAPQPGLSAPGWQLTSAPLSCSVHKRRCRILQSLVEEPMRPSRVEIHFPIIGILVAEPLN